MQSQHVILSIIPSAKVGGQELNYFADNKIMQVGLGNPHKKFKFDTIKIRAVMKYF